MARRKVRLAWIPNASARRATYKKRRDCLVRKVKEISTLTGEEACVIIMSPEDGDPPTFWPPSILEILERFFSLALADQRRKTTTVDSFLQEKAAKMEEQYKKERQKAKEMELNYIMHSIYTHGKPVSSLTFTECYELYWYMEDMKKRSELRQQHLEQNDSSHSTVTGPSASPPSPVRPSMMSGAEAHFWDQWSAVLRNNMFGANGRVNP